MSLVRVIMYYKNNKMMYVENQDMRSTIELLAITCHLRFL